MQARAHFEKKNVVIISAITGDMEGSRYGGMEMTADIRACSGDMQVISQKPGSRDLQTR
jgi:hypothetical protein